MKKFIVYIVFDICLLLFAVDTQISYAQNEVKQKQDTNYRIGNPNDVPGVEKIIYHWGRLENGITVDISTVKPLTKKEKDSISKVLFERRMLRERRIEDKRQYYLKMKDSINRTIVNDTINNNISN